MDTGLIVDGAAEAAIAGGTFERRDPVTGRVATRAAAASLADVSKVVAAAAAAFPAWSETGPGLRRALLLKAADLLEPRAADFTRTMLEETGATAPWAGFNVHLGAGILRECAALTTQILGDVIPSDKPDVLALAVRQPVGVVLGMAPWNAPVVLRVRAVAAALACGNTVILRSSELCLATHHLVGEVLNEAGFPKGVVNVLSNAPADAAAVVEALIAAPAVKRINFTGSTKVGRIIAKLAAEHLKPVLLELGGKAPFLVLDDADLDQAAAAAFGAFLNQGQICMSTERFIVDECGGCLRRKARGEGGRAAGGRPARSCRARFADRPPARREDGRLDRRCGGARGGDRGGRHARGQHRDRHDPRPRDPRHAHLSGGILRPGEAGRARARHRRGGAGCQRHRIRPLGGGLRAGRAARVQCRPPDREWHLPHQRADGGRRAADAIRRGEGERLWPVRRPRSDRRLHGAALDHDRGAAALPILDG